MTAPARPPHRRPDRRKRSRRAGSPGPPVASAFPLGAHRPDTAHVRLQTHRRSENGNHTGRCEPNFAASAAERGPSPRRSDTTKRSRLDFPALDSPPRWKDHRRTATRRRRCGSPPGRPVRPLPDRAPAGGPGNGVTVGPVSVHADGLFHLRRSCRTRAGRAGQTMPVSALVRQGPLTRSARLAAEELTAAAGDVQQHVFKRLERAWTRAEPAGPPAVPNQGSDRRAPRTGF